MAVIRDIMSKNVITIRCDATLIDAVRALTDHQLGSAPVVSAEGALIGFVSDVELTDVLFSREVRNAPVSDYMTRNVLAVHPDDSLTAAARAIALYGIRQLPVIENGTLVGIVTPQNLLGYSLRHPEPFTEPLVELIPAIGQFA